MEEKLADTTIVVKDEGVPKIYWCSDRISFARGIETRV